LFHGVDATADIVLTVRDQSGKQVFSQTYAGACPSPTTWSLKSLNQRYQDNVSAALNDAVKKAGDDPAFIAAITERSADTHRSALSEGLLPV
jgi:hypothetical protein